MKTFNLRAIFILISSLFFVHFAQAVDTLTVTIGSPEKHAVAIPADVARAIQHGYSPIYMKKDLKGFQSQDLFKITFRGLNKNIDVGSSGLADKVPGYKLIGFGRPDSVVFEVSIYGKRVDSDHLSEGDETALKGPYKFLKGHILNTKGQKRIVIYYTFKVDAIKGELKIQGGSAGSFNYYVVDYKDLKQQVLNGFDFNARDENGKADSYANYILIDY